VARRRTGEIIRPRTGDEARPAQRRRRATGSTATFVAIDFEAATKAPDSACAVALVRVEDDRLVDQVVRLIRPSSPRFVFTYLHGISWKHVADQPEFGAVWGDLAPLLEGADFLVAHNAPFDRNVMGACCRAAGMNPPKQPWECTVQWARRTWNLRRASLPTVC